MTKKESSFQKSLINELKEKFKGCMIMKNDPNYIQGIPDLIVLFKDKWACLECKKDKTANIQPNQKYYVDKMNEMSYASFVYPENKETVLNELEQTFCSVRKTRNNRSK